MVEYCSLQEEKEEFFLSNKSLKNMHRNSFFVTPSLALSCLTELNNSHFGSNFALFLGSA